jgi:molybdopterin-guanine dinucleotide biosynthesis protein A
VFDQVVIVSSRSPASVEWPHVPDAREGQGPLAGIEAALAHAAALGLDGAFVLACDLPLVDAPTVRAVVDALGDTLAAAPAREGVPAMEPLCAAYRVESLPFVTGALDRGAREAHRVFAALRGATVALPAHLFLNVNTPSDRDRAAAALEPGSA